MFPCCSRRRWRRSSLAPAASMSTARSAPAAMRARFSIAAQMSSPSIAIRRPLRPAPHWSLRPRVGSNLWRRASAISTRSPSVSASRRPTASSWTSGFRRCSSTRGPAAFRCASTRPRHAHGGARAFGRRHPSRRGRGDDRRHSLLFRRGARGAPHCARHRRRPHGQAVHVDTCNSPSSSPASPRRGAAN